MKDDSSQPKKTLTLEAQALRWMCDRLGHRFCFVVGRVLLLLLSGGASALCFWVAATTPAGLSAHDKAEVLTFTPVFYFAGAILAIGCLAVLISAVMEWHNQA